MKLVVIESPFTATTERNFIAHILYARACVRDSLLKGEAPFASHLLYPQDGILRDDVPRERAHGIAAGHALYETVTAYTEPGCIMGRPVCAAYIDFGVSGGMKAGIQAAKIAGCEVVHRSLGEPSGQAVNGRFYDEAKALLSLTGPASAVVSALLLTFPGGAR